MYAPGRITITGGMLSYSRCPSAAVRVTYSPDFVLRRAEAGKGSAGCPASPPATEVEPLLATLLTQSPEVERVNDRGIVLRSRDYFVLLTREADYRRAYGPQIAEWERHLGD
jgi:hypothetical protein